MYHNVLQVFHDVFPCQICLPGTELLQSPFRTELGLVSRSRWYRRFLRSYRRFLRRCRDPWGDRRSPIIARLAEHHKTLLNIVKHHETHVKHCDTSWTTIKTSWATSKTSWNTLKTLWNTHHSMRRYRCSMRRRRPLVLRSRGDHSMRRYRRSMQRLRRRRRSRGVSGDIGAEFSAISAIA